MEARLSVQERPPLLPVSLCPASSFFTHGKVKVRTSPQTTTRVSQALYWHPRFTTLPVRNKAPPDPPTRDSDCRAHKQVEANLTVREQKAACLLLRWRVPSIPTVRTWGTSPHFRSNSAQYQQTATDQDPTFSHPPRICAEHRDVQRTVPSTDSKETGSEGVKQWQS